MPLYSNFCHHAARSDRGTRHKVRYLTQLKIGERNLTNTQPNTAYFLAAASIVENTSTIWLTM